MPVSTSVHISQCLNWIINLNPASVLDVGCGFGLWGFLCREYLDVINERVQPETWRARIDGIELFEPYILAHQRALYSSIQIADIRDAASQVDAYDLIITGDVIEHLEKSEGEAVLEQLYEKARKALLVNIPIGEGWDHPERHGNPGELHRSQWYVEDFLPYPCEHRLFELPCGKYGVFYCPKLDEPTPRVEGLLAAADHHFRKGDLTKALRYARQGYALDPGHRETALFLADALIRDGHADQAAEVLAQTITVDPSFHFGYLVLAKLLAMRSQRSQALERLAALLSRDDLSPEVRGEAEELKRKLCTTNG